MRLNSFPTETLFLSHMSTILTYLLIFLCYLRFFCLQSCESQAFSKTQPWARPSFMARPWESFSLFLAPALTSSSTTRASYPLQSLCLCQWHCLLLNLRGKPQGQKSSCWGTCALGIHRGFTGMDKESVSRFQLPYILLSKTDMLETVCSKGCPFPTPLKSPLALRQGKKGTVGCPTV